MTPSEEVRKLLDERGVEWWPLGSNMTECVVDGVRIKYRQVGRGLIVSTCTEGTVKPAQAIAATLGNSEFGFDQARYRKVCRLLEEATMTMAEWGCDGPED